MQASWPIFFPICDLHNLINSLVRSHDGIDSPFRLIAAQLTQLENRAFAILIAILHKDLRYTSAMIAVVLTVSNSIVSSI